MGLKFRPTDSTFYDLFTEAANHLVTGSALLAEMLSAEVDHEYVAKQMRDPAELRHRPRRGECGQCRDRRSEHHTSLDGSVPHVPSLRVSLPP